MDSFAVLKYARVSARKARLVADLVRGKDVAQAIEMLTFADKKSAPLIKKLVESAVANAEHAASRSSESLDVDELFVKTITVDAGPSLRRFRPRDQGAKKDESHHRRPRHAGGLIMGQKVHPTGFRVGITAGWDSKWFADRDYGRFVAEDLKIREHVKERLNSAGVSKILIERAANKAKVFVHAAKPGIILGKRATGLDALRQELQQLTSTEVYVHIIEVRKVETESVLVAENIAQQLVKRVAFRRAMKKAIASARRAGAKGIKVMCTGRLGGAEMSRQEWYREGRVPLHTLRADIDYGFAEAETTYGIVGVKVWIFKGEKLAGEESRQF